MAGSFSGINSLSQALRAFQRGLDVTGHNISNANTIGYSRQLISYVANPADLYFGPNGAFQVGNGVSVDDVARVRDFLTDRSMWNAQGDMGRFQALASSLKSVEGVFPEPGDQGINDALGKFFDAWSGLSSSPNDPAAKLAVQQAGLTLTARVRQTYAGLTTEANTTKTDINQTFDGIDQLSAQIADLNAEIVAKQATGATPNDLLDLRDQAIEQLSGLMDVQVQRFDDGSLAVYSGQITLVSESASFKVPRTYDAATGTLTGNGVTSVLKGGSLAGLMQSLAKTQGYQTQLDAFANNLKTEINKIHETGTNGAGDTGIDFFADGNPQTGAADFSLTDAIKASPDGIMSGTSGAAGDGSVALALSRLRDASIAGLGAKSFKDFYGNLVATVGTDSAYYADQVSTTAAVMTQIDNQRQAISGVNIDDEMANMLRYQRSYQAAAKALSVMDSVTEDLLGMIR